MKLAGMIVAAGLFVGAMATGSAANAETWTLTDATDGYSLTLSSLTGHNGYTGGPVQTWGIQSDTSYSSGWTDFNLDGETLSSEANTPNFTSLTATSPFFSVSGDKITSLTLGKIALTDGSTLTVSAAPEPATWALMFGGVAMAGGALRLSRKKSAALATA